MTKKRTSEVYRFLSVASMKKMNDDERIALIRLLRTMKPVFVELKDAVDDALEKAKAEMKDESHIVDFVNKAVEDLSNKPANIETNIMTAETFNRLCFSNDWNFAQIEELEEVLITADIGPVATMEIIEQVRDEASRGVLKDIEKLSEAIKNKIIEMLSSVKTDTEIEAKPFVILVVGVNGVGKTTSIAKLSNLYKNNGKNVMLAAGDTFRAAAEEQLDIWAKRAEVDILREDKADSASLAYRSIDMARTKLIIPQTNN